jgi:hypothetical protein
MHFHVHIVYSEAMLRRREEMFLDAREIGAGGLCPPLRDSPEAKSLQSDSPSPRNGGAPPGDIHPAPGADEL